MIQVEVLTTNGRGHTPEEIAARAARRIVGISDTAPPDIRDQAKAFQSKIEAVLVHYMREAVQSDRTTVYNALTDAGHPALADLIRRL